nr:MAG TPA: hypothetical protein [Caudoviricetes sp.]
MIKYYHNKIKQSTAFSFFYCIVIKCVIYYSHGGNKQ